MDCSVKICLRQLRWIFMFSLVFIAGCLMTPIPIEIEYGLPPEKYDYLAMAVRLEIFVRQELDAQQCADLQRVSRKIYAVWKEPQKYKLPSYPSAWPQEEVSAMRAVTRSETLNYLEFVLGTADPVPYEHDVRYAVEVLSTLVDLPSEKCPVLK